MSQPDLFGAKPQGYASLDELFGVMMQMKDDPLANAGTNVVISRGNPKARLLLVGEAPRWWSSAASRCNAHSEQVRMKRPLLRGAGQGFFLERQWAGMRERAHRMWKAGGSASFVDGELSLLANTISMAAFAVCGSAGSMIAASDALERLQEGNRRFVSGVRSLEAIVSQTKRSDLVTGQAPFAIVLGCSDSRVPAEIIFDQGLGDLFVIRVAGNVVAPSQIGSVEFAAERYGTPLVVVLGHSLCGAVIATLEALEHPEQAASFNVLSIVNRIRPSVESLFETELRRNPERLLHAAVRANIRAATSHLRHGSPILENLIQEGRLEIVGAQYFLETGEVSFFERLPAMADERA